MTQNENIGKGLLATTWLLLAAYHTAAFVDFFPEDWVSTNPTHVMVVYSVLGLMLVGFFLTMRK